MANNRLYIGDTDTHTYMYLTKSYGGGSWADYNLNGLAENFKEFMRLNPDSPESHVGGSTSLILFTENDSIWYRYFIESDDSIELKNPEV